MGKSDANENSADMTMSTTLRQTACGPAREPHAEGAYLSIQKPEDQPKRIVWKPTVSTLQHYSTTALHYRTE